MNLEDVIDPETVNSVHALQQDEWSLSKPRFGEEGQLEVIGWSGRDKCGKGNKFYILKCGKCSQDSGLFGDGYFKTTKGNLVTLGQTPCGCSSVPRWTKDQFAVLCKRKAKELGYEFLGFAGEWKGCYTKIKMCCVKHGNWSSGSIRDLINKGNGCPGCRRDTIREASTKPDDVMIASFRKSGAFHPDTRFWKSDRVTSRGWKSYWYMSCPECGDTGESFTGDLQKGKRPCACNMHRQQECYINWIVDANNTAVAIKFGIANNSKQRIKSQNRQSSYEVRQHQVYTFPTVQSCKQAERECKKELECGVVLKRDMPDGWTETTSVLNLSKVVGIYKRNGGVLNGLNKVVVAVQASSVVTPVKLSYTTYVNTPMSVIMEYSLHNPKVYVIVFYTLDYVGTDDWDESLGKSWATRVLSPVWVVSKKEMELHVNHFLTFDGTTKDNWEVV